MKAKLIIAAAVIAASLNSCSSFKYHYAETRIADAGTDVFVIPPTVKVQVNPVSFSDFQLDSFSGFFGGEIRLAYLFTDGGVKVLTGGSINGNISEAQGDMTFSLERYADSSYEGPLAVKLKGVRVAGC